MNSWKDNGTVNLPWMHPQVLPQVRAAIELRHRLVPYLYTQMWRAAGENEPAVRPLLWDFPADAAARDVEDAFMLGPDLLVAPVLEEGTTQRIVDLPMHPGGWYDWHDGSHLKGGRAVTVDAPLGRLPLFARAGAVIPVVEASETTLIVFGASANSGFDRFYVDDGETAHWWRDGYSMEFRLRREGAGFALERELSTSAPASIPTIGVRAVDLPGLRLASSGLTVSS